MKRNNELRLSRMSARSGAGAFETTITRGLGADSTRRESQRGLHARTLPTVALVGTGSGVGLWIDHRNAVIVFVTPEGVNTTMVLSRTEKQPGRIGGRRSTARFEPQLVPADDSQARRYTGQLDLYYDAVIACLREARSILAFGPGEARDELRRRLALNKHDHRSFAFEVADKMTRRQIEAKTLEWFDAARLSAPAPRRRSGRPER